jgi:hypothetical protein
MRLMEKTYPQELTFEWHKTFQKEEMRWKMSRSPMLPYDFLFPKSSNLLKKPISSQLKTPIGNGKLLEALSQNDFSGDALWPVRVIWGSSFQWKPLRRG